jgi:hypothetical protein
MKLVSVDGNPAIYSKPEADDNCLHYSNIALDTDFNWQLLPSKVSGWITLHSDMAPRQWTWEFIHSDKVVIARTRKGVDAEGNSLEIECDMETTVLKEGLYRTRLTKTWTGRVGVRNRKTRKMEWSDNPVYPVAIDPDISEEIVAANDNGYENDGSWYTSAVRFGYASQLINAGWRFQTVAVPNGDDIDLATFKSYVTLYGSPDAYGTMYGYDTDDAVAFSNGKLPNSLAKTTASTSFPKQTSNGQKSFTVTGIVQEIIVRGGWSTGNDLSLFVIAASASQYNYQYHSYYPDSGKHGRLEIDYSAPAGGGAAPLPLSALDIFSPSIIQGI